ncbi:uncharacterized protein LOC122514639 isoform X1 [Polistes fuscatus]|uniref:uncharacterized protein LOC122514639 isoform X1 n=2 Tax=Polistes fuscatus TaxID=30207 RepID=UPI001CA7BE6D|nr:uncharacterized protein LOC122514639 isoform X1 [Polistes fuscatus]
MKLTEILGCTLFLWSQVFFSTINSAAVQRQPKNVNVTNVPMRINATTYDDDAEDFVPYLGERFNVFDWILFKAMGKMYEGNILVSPISIKLALVLLYEGAQDHTAQELVGVLQLPVSRSAIREKFGEILLSLKMMRPEYELNLGTRLYIDNSIMTRQRYAAIIDAFYGVNLINANLSDTQSTTNNINSWVKNVTHGNLDKLIEDETTLKDSVMLVVNALFFKGIWRRRFFKTEDIRTDKFYISDKNVVEVPFMTTSNRFYYTESSELNAKILRLPYDGHKFAMYLILPFNVNGINRLIKEISPFILARQAWLMQDMPVDVTIPKFKFDFTSHLESVLRKVGIRDIFDDTATLTGILKTKRESRRLIVKDILQKTGIEVNENGTSAYAATAVQVGNKIGDQTFYANHPFVFYIEDETTGTILYIGKVMNPLQQEGSTKNKNVNTSSRFNEKTEPTVPSTSVVSIPTEEERYNFFNVDLLQEIIKENEGNVIVSPTSIKLALTILAEGAGGETREEIHNALRFTKNMYQIRVTSQRALTALKSVKNGTEIDGATRLWAKNGLPITQSYRFVLRQYYDTDVQFLDFSDRQTTEQEINNWVRVATRNNIQSISDPGSISADTSLILTSALYFKGRWQLSFYKKAGFNGCFYVPKIGCQNTDFMANTAEYRYGNIESLNADVVEIPYTDGKTVMLIILPNNKEIDQNLTVLSKDLSYVSMSALLANIYLTEVNLIIPKFSIENKLDLKSVLKSLGIRSIFNKRANFSNIVNDTVMYVENIIQNAKIEVNEEGTVASAVTELTIVPLMGSNKEVFRADHPFLFAIVDLQTNATLFAGRYMHPNLNNKSTIQ